VNRKQFGTAISVTNQWRGSARFRFNQKRQNRVADGIRNEPELARLLIVKSFMFPINFENAFLLVRGSYG
jgi:hypothetical protein